jgi:hypothetical protein
MPKYEVTVQVEYCYEVEADDQFEAEKQGWEYEDYRYSATVDSIEVKEIEEEEEEDN